MATDGGDREAYQSALRAALQHLYDPIVLRVSPLLALFALDAGHDPVGSLRRYLLGGIRALKPPNSVPLHAEAWRLYHVLTYRYVEQTGQREVATDLALSVRHLRRQEGEAIAVLADYLIARHGLDAATLGFRAPQRSGDVSPRQEAGSLTRKQELAWLSESLPNEIVDLSSVVASAVKIVRPLAQRSGVDVEWERPTDLPPVRGQGVGIRQAVLNLLSAAVQSVPGGTVRLSATTDGDEARVVVCAEGHTPAALSASTELADNLEMARQLARVSGGRLEEPEDRPAGVILATTLVLPAVERVPVLVIDDNADALRLMERYLAGTRFEFTGVRDPGRALRVAEESVPRIVVLDIMLPGIDGWELLGHLREHPRLGDVPILVHTILPQERLALALGAAGFLRKPASRQALLEELDRQLELLSTAAC